ncbi:MAG: alanine--glyoxylate aminotransferase family protein [Deltaproteobacteria bacterium]|nr:alanine--glyoxylate aminotransferase family protein [Deltaproteobacteria bacterium]
MPASVAPPQRVLLGPGPSDVDPAVLAALARPTIGHLDPAFVSIMDEVRSMLQTAFGTSNRLTMPMSGTGSAGMEAAIVNLVEPGDRVLVGVNGVFGRRMCEVAKRAGAEVVPVQAPWGRALDPEDFRAAAAGRPVRLLCIVHAETSTGVLQELTGFREVADAVGALLLIDAVTSLGGVPVELDRFGVDMAYSGTQKCLSCPPGLAPLSASDRAVARIQSREQAPVSWYLDLSLLATYWLGKAGGGRAYHHTAPINMVYALHEALRIALSEGLEARFARHRAVSAGLRAGLVAMGLELPVSEAERLPQLTLVRVPDGVDEAAARRFLLTERSLEIGGGLGAFAGKAWRIGMMGSACTPENARFCATSLRDALAAQGHVVADPAAAMDEAFKA